MEKAFRLETFELLRNESGQWLQVAAFDADAEDAETLIRAEPFDAIELDLAVLWADVQL